MITGEKYDDRSQDAQTLIWKEAAHNGAVISDASAEAA